MKTSLYPLFAAGFCATALLAPGASAQGEFTFSVSWRSGSLGVLSSNVGNQMNEGDVLAFGPGAPGFGPLQAPNKSLLGSQLGLVRYGVCLDHQPETPCGIEVDALSQGLDTLLTDFAFGPGPISPQDVWFSTDDLAMGVAGSGPGPNLLSEGPAMDAAADVMVTYGLGVGPIGPSPAPGRHVGVFDGNGLASASGAVYVGIGLLEPGSPTQPLPPWDDLDSLDIGAITGFPPSGYYLSVDGGITDPATGIVGSNTAAAQGVSAADVLFVAGPGATPAPYAPALVLGLDPVLDDIDALTLRENGVAGFQKSSAPYDWTTGASDMLLFSVRRGSAIIGTPDSIFGAPIEPGDILIAPFSGQPGTPPGIFFSAESLGLATTRANPILTHGDDLNALDIASAPCFDCNNNGVEDQVDISTGGSSDVNGNGIPDECERIGEFCACPSGSAPCSNANPTAGCSNSETAGAHLAYLSGSIMVSSDDLVLSCDGVPKNKFGLFYMGGGQANTPIGDGVACVSGRGVGTYRYGVQSSGAGGVLSLGPGLVSTSCSSFPPTGCIAAGDTWNFQAWYRDPAGPCGSGFNFSNGIEVEFVP